MQPWYHTAVAGARHHHSAVNDPDTSPREFWYGRKKETLEQKTHASDAKYDL
jgi:hypothetical protein